MLNLSRGHGNLDVFSLMQAFLVGMLNLSRGHGNLAVRLVVHQV